MKAALSAIALAAFALAGCVSNKPAHPELRESQIVQARVSSKILGKPMNVIVYLPPGFTNERRYPVLYLLHGYSDDETKWKDALHIDVCADRLINAGKIHPLLIVMPQIDNSFGLNTDEIKRLSGAFSSGRYEDYIMQELLPYVDRSFNTAPGKNGRYIGGISMGGWAALHLAFKYEKKFAKVGAHSPALINDAWLYPNFEARNSLDPVFIASEKNLGPLEIYLDCGDRDGFRFYEGCGDLYRALQRNGYACEYHLNSGAHDDAYWLGNIEDYLLFYSGI